MDTERRAPAERSGTIRRALRVVEHHLRLQRQLLWHPRLGLRPVVVNRSQPVYRRRIR